MSAERTGCKFRVLGAVHGVTTVVLGSWIAGFDFDARGFDSLLVYLMANVMACGFAVAYGMVSGEIDT